MTTAAEIARGLGGKWRGRSSTMCFCPAHDNTRTEALSISETTDGLPLVHCFSGCPQLAVIDALRKRGLWPEGEVAYHPSHPNRLTIRPDGLKADERQRRRAAREIWDAALPIARSLGERHLREVRGILGPLPECLRFAPRIKHPTGYTAPAIVARVRTGLGEFTAIQRIFIEPDGGRSKLEPRKLTLGPMLDGAVDLHEPRGMLGIAEGIETALAARQMFRIPTWACLGAQRLGRLVVPRGITDIVIFADNGDVGRREAYRAAEIYEGKGLTVIVRPPDGDYPDHNDWLLAGAGRAA